MRAVSTGAPLAVLAGDVPSGPRRRLARLMPACLPAAMSRLVLIALMTLVACAEPPTGPPGPLAEAPAVPADSVGAMPTGRPEAVRDTIQVEGMDQAVTLRLVSFPDVPLPFSTYVREGWRSGTVASGEGTAVRLTTGEPPRQGLVSLFVPADAASEAEVAELAQASAESYGGARERDAAETWARRSWTFQDGDTVGSVRLGEHAGTFFYVLEAYPIDMGDGFAPAARVALDRLWWLDDGTAL